MQSPLTENGIPSVSSVNTVQLLALNNSSLVYDNLFLDVIGSIDQIEHESEVDSLLLDEVWFFSMKISLFLDGMGKWDACNVVFLPDRLFLQLFDSFDLSMYLVSGSENVDSWNVTILPYDVNDPLISDGNIGDVKLSDVRNSSVMASRFLSKKEIQFSLHRLTEVSDFTDSLFSVLSNRSLLLPINSAVEFLNEFNFLRSEISMSMEWIFNVGILRYRNWGFIQEVANKLEGYDGSIGYFGFVFKISRDFSVFVTGVTKELYRMQAIVLILSLIFFMFLSIVFLSFYSVIQQRIRHEERVMYFWGVNKQVVQRLYRVENALMSAAGFVFGSMSSYIIAFFMYKVFSQNVIFAHEVAVSPRVLIVVFVESSSILLLVMVVVWGLFLIGKRWVRSSLNLETIMFIEFVVIAGMIYAMYLGLGYINMLQDARARMIFDSFLFFGNVLLFLVSVKIGIEALHVVWTKLDIKVRVKKNRVIGLIFHFLIVHKRFWLKYAVTILLGFVLVFNAFITPYSALRVEIQESRFRLGGDVLVDTGVNSVNMSEAFSWDNHIINGMNVTVYFNAFGLGLFQILVDPGQLQYLSALGRECNSRHDSFFEKSLGLRNEFVLFSNSSKFNTEVGKAIIGNDFLLSDKENKREKALSYDFLDDEILFMQFLQMKKIVGWSDSMILSVQTFNELMNFFQIETNSLVSFHFLLLLVNTINHVDSVVSSIWGDNDVINVYSILDSLHLSHDVAVSLLLLQGIYLVMIIPLILIAWGVLFGMIVKREMSETFIALLNMGFKESWVKKLVILENAVSLIILIFLDVLLVYPMRQGIEHSLYLPKVLILSGSDFVRSSILLGTSSFMLLFTPFLLVILKSSLKTQHRRSEV